MVERSPILSAKNDNQEIGYVEGAAAYDLLGNKRCNYNPSTGNLLELDSGRTIGHVSLAGHFLGVSWIADELFPPPGAIGAPTTSPDETTSDSPQASFHWSIAQHHETLTTSSQEDADQTVPATSCDEPFSAAAITLTASSREPTDAAAIALAPAADQPIAAELPTTSPNESSASDAAVSLKSLDAPAVTDAVTLTTSFDEPPSAASNEAPLSSNAEDALEMIRIAMQMRERLGRDLRPDDFTDATDRFEGLVKGQMNDTARNRLFK